ncbi:MAG TPA: aminotransferase class III-fold pyridoxal phosphate-dependent enzyme, partial [Thermoanaerobaculia bacterium]
ARAMRLGAWTGERLAALRDLSPAVTGVRGRGLLWGIELATTGAAKAWVSAAQERGVLFLAGGPEGRVAQVVPPLNIPEEQLARALDILQEALVA